ncbi:MAG: hypothetical protein HZA52_02710 [Planctomycetes bacterium]|nr:hypothetical protein [Planctomycetota bacterium]
MNVWRALWWKEARDHRVLFATCALLYVALLAGAELVLGDGFDATLRLGAIHPAALLVVAAAFAAEALAHDAASGVETTLMRLPVSRWKLWSAKASFVVAALAGFELVAFAAELVLASFEPAADSSRLTPVFAWWLAALLAAASLLRRALPAALVGVGVPALLGWLVLGAERMPNVDLLGRVASASGPLGVALALTAALCIASVAAYCVVRFDRFGLRRVGAFAAGGMCVVAPPLAWTFASTSSRADLVPFTHGVSIWNVRPSPDGRYVALQAERVAKLDGDWPTLSRESWLSTTELSRLEVWILDRATGECRELDDRWRSIWSPSRRGWSAREWTSDGHLLTVSAPGTFGSGEYRYELVDPRTARVVESFGDDSDALELAADIPPSWYRLERIGNHSVLALADGSHGVRLRDDQPVTLSPEVGIAFYRDEAGALLRKNLLDGSERVFARFDGESIGRPRVSPDGRWVAIQEREKLSIRGARDGELVFGPEQGVLVEWSSHGRLATITHRDATFALGLDGSRVELPRAWPIECGAEGFVTRLPDRVEWHSLDGARVETIYAVR